MSIKTIALIAVAVIGALAAVHFVRTHNTAGNHTAVVNSTQVHHDLALLSVGSKPVNYEMLYLHYKKTQNLTFGSAEDSTRFTIFKANCDKIVAHNANKSATYELGLTSLSHLTREEFAATRLGYKAHKKTPVAQRKTVTPNVTAPASVDWSTKGAVTPIKNQGQCGSCWSFSATGSLEGLAFIKTGKLPSLSEQELVDCSGSYGNEGCNGGLMDSAFQYAAAKGLTTESNYAYTATDGSCNTKKAQTIAFQNKGFQDVTPNSDSALGAAIAQQPVSVAIEADTDVFQLYQSGVLTSDACGTQLDHGVLAVGYGSESGKNYIKVKNSWGASWGQSGYVLIGRANGAGICGINSDASYPTL